MFLAQYIPKEITVYQNAVETVGFFGDFSTAHHQGQNL